MQLKGLGEAWIECRGHRVLSSESFEQLGVVIKHFLRRAFEGRPELSAVQVLLNRLSQNARKAPWVICGKLA